MMTMTTRSTYPDWLFDGSEIDDPLGHGGRAVRFLRAMKHPKSGKPNKALALDPWQERLVKRIYGTRNPDGTRTIKTVVLLLGRGNRKTSLAGALSVLHCVGPEHIPAGECILAASDRKQAGYAFAEAASIIRENRHLAAATRIYDAHNSVKKIVFKKDNSFLEAISGDAGTQHGRTPSFVCIDELHTFGSAGAELWKALKSAMPKTKGSLMVIATTAGRGQDNIAWEIIDRARKVASGEINDPTLLPILFETDADADWRDESLWYRVNPGLSLGYQDIDGLRQLASEAETSPTARDMFRQYNLGVWLDNSTSPFVDMGTYSEGSAPIDYEALVGRPVWVGVDMSKTTDLSAVVACFRDGDTYTVLPHFFCPEDDIRKRGDVDGVDYVRWSKEGHLTATPGNVIDNGAVAGYIRELCGRFDVREIAFDATYAQAVMAPLVEEGLPVITMQQGWVTQSPALNTLEAAIISGKFRHGGHPVLRWNFSNIAIKSDTNGNRTIHKGKSTDRIDGASATWMAVSRAAAGEGYASFLDNPDVTADMLVLE